MVRFFLGLLVISLLVGCSSKEEQALLASYGKKNQYHKNLLHTEKAELSNAEDTLAILTATHLYTQNLDKNDTRDEVFIIGVQFEDAENSRLVFDKTANTLAHNEYLVTLNNTPAKKVVHLDNDNPKLKEVSFVTDWGEYYEVTFSNAGTKFSLIFENPQYGKQALLFSKKPKYVFTKKGF